MKSDYNQDEWSVYDDVKLYADTIEKLRAGLNNALQMGPKSYVDMYQDSIKETYKFLDSQSATDANGQTQTMCFLVKKELNDRDLKRKKEEQKAEKVSNILSSASQNSPETQPQSQNRV